MDIEELKRRSESNLPYTNRENILGSTKSREKAG